MVLNIIVSFLVALLMGMGVGGGGLFVIFLTMCLNYGQIYAQGTNLVFFIIAILSSIFVHLRKRKLYFKQIFVMAIIGSITLLAYPFFDDRKARTNPTEKEKANAIKLLKKVVRKAT